MIKKWNVFNERINISNEELEDHFQDIIDDFDLKISSNEITDSNGLYTSLYYLISDKFKVPKSEIFLFYEIHKISMKSLNKKDIVRDDDPVKKLNKEIELRSKLISSSNRFSKFFGTETIYIYVGDSRIEIFVIKKKEN